MSVSRPLAAPETAVLATLRGGGRIWAVGAIHGDVGGLRRLHAQIAQGLRAGDQIVYLGGYLGWGTAVAETVEELLLFRRAFISRPGVAMEDMVFLRGAQEEMWQKLLQLQFAAQPTDVLRWMLDHGIGSTIAAYGASEADGLAAADDGVLALTRWTGVLRQSMRAADGHTALLSALKHAAITDDNSLLFVHAGIDPTASLSAQRDHFWWGTPAFEAMDRPYDSIQVIVRGHAPRGGISKIGPPVTTLDAGAGRGGPLVAGCFGPNGEALQVLEA
jgi:serine/threonine protein phosphatase 1